VASTRYPVAVIDEAERFLGEVYVSTIIASMIQEQNAEEDDQVEQESGEPISDEADPELRKERVMTEFPQFLRITAGRLD
jgi:hypothetical protein